MWEHFEKNDDNDDDDDDDGEDDDEDDDGDEDDDDAHDADDDGDYDEDEDGSMIHSVSCAWLLSCHVSGISTTIFAFIDVSYNFNTSLFLHLRNFLMGHILPIAVSFFRNFRPGACRAISGNCLYGSFLNWRYHCIILKRIGNWGVHKNNNNI